MSEEVKLFNKYTYSDVVVTDMGLKSYITLSPIIIPRTLGRYACKKFGKTKMTIIERLINKLMVPGHKRKRHFWTSRQCTGKSHTTYNIVKEVFEIIEQKTKKNPLQIFVNAVQKASPCEEITTIEYGGIKQPKAVDTSPQRRVDLAIKWLVQGTYQATINKKTRAAVVLANMIMKTAEGDVQSFPLKMRSELERQAAASR